MAEAIKPLSRWNTGTTQNAIPANDNVLRVEVLEFPALSVLSAQPGSPTDGDIHILGAVPSGAQWAIFAEHDVVIFDSGTWYAFEPFEGWLKKDLDSGDMLEFDGTEWVVFTTGGGGGADLDLDGTPAADDTYEGVTISGINAGATTAQWEAVYLGSGGEWLLADASADTTAPARGIGVAAGSDNNPLTVLTQGVIRNDAWAWTPGGTLYLSTTAGGITQTAPSAAGEIVQQLGFALSADVAYIDIGDATYIEVAA